MDYYFIIIISIWIIVKYFEGQIGLFFFMSFAENLRRELDYQGLIVKQLATKTEISINTLNHYLKGRQSIPPADVALRIAHALGVTVEYLVTGVAESNCDNALFNLSPEARLIAKCADQLDEPTRKIALALMQTLQTSTAL
jgi:transcriptional regulator with XRE-family HTH domain